MVCFFLLFDRWENTAQTAGTALAQSLGSWWGASATMTDPQVTVAASAQKCIPAQVCWKTSSFRMEFWGILQSSQIETVWQNRKQMYGVLVCSMGSGEWVEEKWASICVSAETIALLFLPCLLSLVGASWPVTHPYWPQSILLFWCAPP